MPSPSLIEAFNAAQERHSAAVADPAYDDPEWAADAAWGALTM